MKAELYSGGHADGSVRASGLQQAPGWGGNVTCKAFKISAVRIRHRDPFLQTLLMPFICFVKRQIEGSRCHR